MSTPAPIPVWQLYGEDIPFPDLLHIERIVDRAAGLDWVITPHRHLHLHQVFLLSSGRITFEIDGESQHLVPSVILNIPPGRVHGFAFSAGTEGYVLTLPVRDHPAIFAAGSPLAAGAAQLVIRPASPESPGLFEALAQSWQRRAGFRDIELRARAALIFCALLEGAAAPARRADPRFSRFEALVRQTLPEHLPLARYAADLNLSLRHLNRICRAESGLSASAYIETQTHHEACRLLAYTRLSVQQIAWQLGYADPSYFSRSFRRRMGHSPLGYRLALAGQGEAAAQRVEED